ncbi:MAG: 4Fe-4S binding protein, partial [Bacteroidaceae bacterium]|nr:4Fe-4S binding protein [Bacteroidaceae bacterium]
MSTDKISEEPLRCLLLYFTGTFNTRYVTKKVCECMERNGFIVTTYEIDPLRTVRLDLSSYHIIGLGSPIHGFCAPYAFLRFIRHQKFPRGVRTFIYKNSGETYPVNDASHKYVAKKLKKDGAILQGEYHFMMPYNIHFRFPDPLVREMMEMNRRLMEIMVYELKYVIFNRTTPGWWARIVSTVISRPQYVAGRVNSYFYKADKKKCIACNRCIRNCPTRNIYRDKKDNLAFRHDCLMCMRCSLNCPTSAIHSGFLDDWGWR